MLHCVQSLSIRHGFISGIVDSGIRGLGIVGFGLGIGAIVVGGIKGPTSQRLLTHLQADPGLGITWGQALPLISSLLTQLVPHQVQSLSVWHCFISGIGGSGLGIVGFGSGIMGSGGLGRREPTLQKLSMHLQATPILGITSGQILVLSRLLIQSIPHQVQSLSVWHGILEIGGSGS
ncbi:MAG: hypothetical protein ACP5HL_01290 [Minisyncoccia bacterium]